MSMIDFAIKEVGDDRYSSGIQSYPLLSSVLLVPPPFTRLLPFTFRILSSWAKLLQ